MGENDKQFRVWHGIAALILAAAVIFVVSPILAGRIGLYGTLIGEWLMLAAVVLLAVFSKRNPQIIFPFRKPTGAGIFGTVLMWVGSFLVEMTLVLCISIFFPEKVIGGNAGLSFVMLSVPFWAAVLIIAVTPAVCEEAVFRGVFFQSLNPKKNKWAAILISGAIFGAFHGDAVRFVPTAIGGVVMAYIMLESGSMFYNCLFHFINNLLPLVLLFGMKDMYTQMGGYDVGSVQMGSMSVASAGIYMAMCAIAPACLYIGNYLLHSNIPGYRDTLFPSGRPGTVIALITVSAFLFIAGIVLAAVGLVGTIQG